MFKFSCILIILGLIFIQSFCFSKEKEEKLKNKLTFALAADLWISDPDGGNREQLTRYGGVSEPSWSPDGKSIVYVCDKEIWKYDFATKKSAKLTNLNGDSINPSFSPDGNIIVFTHESNKWDPVIGKNYTEIWTMNSDGSHPKVLIPAKNSWKCYPAMSPWGDEILFNELKGNSMNYYLAIYNLSSGHKDYLSSEEGWLEPAFSRNGSYVASGFYNYEEGGGLYFINLKTLKEKNIIPLARACQFCSPSFSPGDNKIVVEKQLYSSQKRMFFPYGIYTLNTDGSGLNLCIIDASDPEWL